MNQKHHIANAILWAAAIIAAAIMHAPPVLCTILLPTLAATALLITRPKKSRGALCRA